MDHLLSQAGEVSAPGEGGEERSVGSCLSYQENVSQK